MQHTKETKTFKNLRQSHSSRKKLPTVAMNSNFEVQIWNLGFKTAAFICLLDCNNHGVV